MPDDARYFELLDHVGVADDGTLQPAAEIGFLLSVPAMSAIGPTMKLKRAKVKPFAPTAHPRLVRTNDPAVAAAILSTGGFREVNPPQSETSRTRRKAAATAPRVRGARTPQET